MTVLSASSANELFVQAAHLVVGHGADAAPRGMSTKELLGVHLHLAEPRRRLIHLPPTRVLNPAFAVAEAVWILSGSDDPWIFDFNAQLQQFADEGILRGAYGPRLRRWHGVDQLDHVRRLLLADSDTRRAVIQLFDPARDHVGGSDIPCTLGFRFFLRAGRLDMHTTMRSQDLWLGLPYDLFTFTLIHELMAGWINVDLGEYRHSVDSLHLYEQHWEPAEALPSQAFGGQLEPVAVEWAGLAETLCQVQSGDSAALDPTWSRFAEILRSYRLWKSGERAAAQDTASGISGLLGDNLRTWYTHLRSAPAVIAT